MSNFGNSEVPLFPEPVGLGAGRTAFYAQTGKHTKDIGDQGIDEEVHGFASADKSVLPQPWRRAKVAYPANGFKNPSWQWLDKAGSLAQVEAPCNGYYGFNCDVPTDGFPPVGGPPAAGYDGSTWGLPQGLGLAGKHESGKAILGFPASLAQKRDIGDQGIDEEVHGFASNDKSVLPQPWRRVKTAYPVNGFKNPSWQWLDKPASLAQHKHKHHHKKHHRHHTKTKDIGDQGIDEEVHGFASADKSVLPQPWRRAKVAYPRNGFKNESWQWLDKPASLAQKQDIGNSKYVRPDVWKFVDENIGQIPAYRRRTAPEHKFEPGKSGQGIEIINEGPSK